MKRIYLLRHAKSDWNTQEEGDMERPLAPRGIQAARLIGEYLTRIRQVPDRVLTSPAVRARRTAELAAEGGSWSTSVEIADALYEHSLPRLLALLQEQADDLESVLLVSHEPTCSELAAALITDGAVGEGAEIRFVTASLARFEAPIQEWRELQFGRAALSWLVTPKILTRSVDSA